MATCVNCGKQNVKVMLHTGDDLYKQRHKGWCQDCYKQTYREDENQAIGTFKGIFKKLFGNQSLPNKTYSEEPIQYETYFKEPIKSEPFSEEKRIQNEKECIAYRKKYGLPPLQSNICSNDQSKHEPSFEEITAKKEPTEEEKRIQNEKECIAYRKKYGLPPLQK